MIDGDNEHCVLNNIGLIIRSDQIATLKIKKDKTINVC